MAVKIISTVFAALVAIASAQNATTSLGGGSSGARLGYGSPDSSTTSMMASPTTSMTPTISYSTETYEDCSTMSDETLTSTGTITITHCPICTQGMVSTADNGTPVWTTVYTTEYLQFCPTGLQPQTYTITESCTSATPSWSSGPGYMPSDFVAATETCSVCGPTPLTQLMTYPSGGSPAYTPAATGMTVNAPATATGTESSTKKHKSKTTECSTCKGTVTTADIPMTTSASIMEGCTGSDCLNMNSSSSIVPYTGGATGNHVGVTALATLIAAVGMAMFFL